MSSLTHVLTLFYKERPQSKGERMIDLVIKIKLDDILEGMELSTPDQSGFINRSTGALVYMLQEYLTDAEDGEPYDDLPEWQQEQMVLAIDILENEDNYISLPTEFDINEYRMMEDFCYKQSGNVQTELLNAINGKGAFRRFKDKILDLDVADAWYTFQDERYQQIAIDFCERHELAYE